MSGKVQEHSATENSSSMRASSQEEGRAPLEGASTFTLWSLLLVWGKVSILAFGGGSSTLLLMRREFVERKRWLTNEEYDRFWGLGQLSPGTNLIAMVILLGRFLGGGIGVVVSLVGLLVPSSLIDALLTAGFVMVQKLQAAQAIIQGIVPATAGIMLTVAIQFAYPRVLQSWKFNYIRLTECLLIIMGSVAALILLHIEDFLVILAAIVTSLALFLPIETVVRARKERAVA